MYAIKYANEEIVLGEHRPGFQKVQSSLVVLMGKLGFVAVLVIALSAVGVQVRQ